MRYWREGLGKWKREKGKEGVGGEEGKKRKKILSPCCLTVGLDMVASSRFEEARTPTLPAFPCTLPWKCVRRKE